jgi:hypothetical protein
MTTRTTTDIEEQFALDLDSLEASMNRLYFHYVLPQQGATTVEELIALPSSTAMCGFVFTVSEAVGGGSATRRPLTLCPSCQHAWETRQQ